MLGGEMFKILTIVFPILTYKKHLGENRIPVEKGAKGIYKPFMKEEMQMAKKHKILTPTSN